MTSWIILFIAGVCEVVWALGLKFSHGLTKPLESIVTVVFMILSMYLLAVAARQIPIGIAYTVWVGIGAIGAFIGGIALFGEKVTAAQLMFFVIVIIGLVGLKLSSIRIY